MFVGKGIDVNEIESKRRMAAIQGLIVALGLYIGFT